MLNHPDPEIQALLTLLEMARDEATLKAARLQARVASLEAENGILKAELEALRAPQAPSPALP